MVMKFKTVQDALKDQTSEGTLLFLKEIIRNLCEANIRKQCGWEKEHRQRFVDFNLD